MDIFWPNVDCTNMISEREVAQIVFKCPTNRIPRSGTVVHKYVISNCLITLLFWNISMFSGVKLIASLISNEYQAVVSSFYCYLTIFW